MKAYTKLNLKYSIITTSLFLFFAFIPRVYANTTNYFIISDDGTLRFGTAPDAQLDVQEVIKKFYINHPDDYDFIDVFTNFFTGGVQRFHVNVKNTVNGIGTPIVDQSSSYGAKARFLGVNYQNSIDLMGDFSTLEDDGLIGWSPLLHEAGHQWSAYIGDTFNCQTNSSCKTGLKLLKDCCHWSDYLDTGTRLNGKNYLDFVDGQIFQDNGDGSFTIANLDGKRFHPLSLYLMGLIPPTDVPDLTLIEPNSFSYNQKSWLAKLLNFFQINRAIAGVNNRLTGTKKTITIQQIINAVGSRSPAYPQTQRDFTTAFVIVTAPGTTLLQSQIDKINYLATNYPATWAKAASYKSTMTVKQFGDTSPSPSQSPAPNVFPTNTLVNDNGTIYLINGSLKIPFTNWAAFQGLRYSIKNVVNGDTSNYQLPQSYRITTSQAPHPWGSWLKVGNKIYYADSSGLIYVPNNKILTNNGGAKKFIISANKYDLAILKKNPKLRPLTNNDPRVIK